MALATIPGYPRIGKHRELKRALEGFWAGKLDAEGLQATAEAIIQANREVQLQAGLDLIPVNDFSFYDQMLDTIGLVGAVPDRYGWSGDTPGMDLYFAMARGGSGDHDVPAMEMTKWFDTNYHYIVPEFHSGTTFRLNGTKPFELLTSALTTGATSKAVLIGPLTLLLLGKSHNDSFDPLTLLDRLLPVYVEIIGKLSAIGADWIQIDEPILTQDLREGELSALQHAYETISAAKGQSRIIVQTYFGHVGKAYDTLVNLPVDGIGLDLVRGAENIDILRANGFPKDKVLVAGVIDGRNIWAADLNERFALLQNLATFVDSELIHVSTSCSLQHVPYDVREETSIDREIASWLAFAEQKLSEVVVLTRGLNHGATAIAEELSASTLLHASAASSPRRHNQAVKERLASLPPDADRRSMAYADRARVQRGRLQLPVLPTTTIGSFPQTSTVRNTRRRFDKDEITLEEYESFIESEIREVIEHQEALGLDVLVHGEPERNDMVQYFGEQLEGFAFTHNGWVQSYGSRYVRPPIIFGDVSRPQPMTVRWATFAQSLSDKPVKGMLTGPVTILNWSFVRDDQPRSETCRQIALAIRDEVADLQEAGISMIQIDEAALREGLPLRRSEWATYLDWAVSSFRLTAAGANPETQIHTHMCYSEFGDIFQAISDLDADVISIENARSGLELLQSFRDQGYDKGVGPGVYDIHSPRVPPTEEIVRNLEETLTVLDSTQVWVNPDCGLKTRKPEESTAALRNMVAAAQLVRSRLVVPAGV